MFRHRQGTRFLGWMDGPEPPLMRARARVRVCWPLIKVLS